MLTDNSMAGGSAGACGATGAKGGELTGSGGLTGTAAQSIQCTSVSYGISCAVPVGDFQHT